MTFGGVTTISGATISPPSAARTTPTTTTSPVAITTTTTKVAVPQEETGMEGKLELSMLLSRGSDSSAQ